MSAVDSTPCPLAGVTKSQLDFNVPEVPLPPIDELKPSLPVLVCLDFLVIVLVVRERFDPHVRSLLQYPNASADRVNKKIKKP